MKLNIVINREQDGPWLQYNAIPKLIRSPSGLSRFSEGVRSTVALDGFSRDDKPKMPKLLWFRSKNKQSAPITTAANEAARPNENGKTKLIENFFGKKKKGNTAKMDLDDSEMARHPLSPRDPYPEHDQAPLPQILTSDRPMRVHTAGRDWDDESSENYYDEQSVRSHNSRQSVESRHDGNLVPTREEDSQQPQINDETAMKQQSKADHLKSNPWSGKANDETAADSQPQINHETALKQDGKADHLKSNPLSGKSNEETAGDSQTQINHEAALKQESKADHLKSNPWPGKANDESAGSSSIIVHDSTATGSAPTNQTPDGAYNIDGAGMPFKWWTWSQPNEAGEQKDSRYCAIMCAFPPAAGE
jgi:hypothetical protein